MTKKHKHRILIVDDDEDILELLQYNLSKEGYTVETLVNSADVIDVATKFKPQLIVLDLLMPPYNGIEVCRMIRTTPALKDVYVFFLSAKSDEYYQHAVFNVGGDEFVEKIIGIKPLLTKVASVLKHDFVIRKSLMKLKAGTLELYRGVETVYDKGNKIVLSKPEFEILFFLVQNPKKKISTAQLIQSLWGSITFMDEASVTNFIASLKRKIGDRYIVETNLNSFQFKPQE